MSDIIETIITAHIRHQKLLEALRRRAHLQFGELEALVQASPATIRRDLAFLEKCGKIVRTHGGVSHPEKVDRELTFDRKRRAALEAKVSIANAAAIFARSAAAVFVDAGSTAFEVGRILLKSANLTIFTNSVPLLSEGSPTGARLVAVGGEVRGVSQALVGSGAIEWARRIRVEVAFLGTSGIDLLAGATTTELSEASVKLAFATAAARVVVVADASKWQAPAPVRFADWGQIHDLVSDFRLDRTGRGALRKKGTRYHQVKS